MLSPTSDTIRLFLHVLAAAVWVGGQIVMGGLVPSLRRADPAAPKAAARAFGRVAWPAFAVVVLTGIWSVAEIDVSNTSTEYQVTVFVKVLLAMAAGAAAVVHQVGRTKVAMAVGGAVGLVASLGAMFAGLLLVSGT